MTDRLVEVLRDKAKSYELTALAASERGDAASALGFSTVAVVLLELAESFETSLEEAA